MNPSMSFTNNPANVRKIFNVKIVVILYLNIIIIFLSLLNTTIPVIYVKLNIFLLIRFIYRNILPVLLQLMHLTAK